MKQLLLLFLLMGIVGSAVAQETTWSVNIAPSISYRLPQTRSLPAKVETVRNVEKPMDTV